MPKPDKQITLTEEASAILGRENEQNPQALVEALCWELAALRHEIASAKHLASQLCDNYAQTKLVNLANFTSAPL